MFEVGLCMLPPRIYRLECARWRFDSKDSRIQKQFSVHGVALDKRHVLLEGCERLSRENAKVSWYRFKENLEPRVVFERRTGGKERVGNEKGGALEVGGEGNGGLAEHSEIGIPTTLRSWRDGKRGSEGDPDPSQKRHSKESTRTGRPR